MSGHTNTPDDWADEMAQEDVDMLIKTKAIFVKDTFIIPLVALTAARYRVCCAKGKEDALLAMEARLKDQP